MKSYTLQAVNNGNQRISISGLGICAIVDEHDDFTLVHRAFLIANNGNTEIELDLSLDDNQKLVQDTLSDYFCEPVFELDDERKAFLEQIA